MFRTFIILLVLACPVRATPPDTITIDESLFAVNDTHLFLIRTAQFNLGLHIFGMKDTFLVAKNIATQRDEEFWPILRQHGASDYDADTGAPSALIQTFPLDGAVNPYQLVAERGALVIRDAAYGTSEPTALTQSGFQFEAARLSAEDITTQMAAAVRATLAAMPAYPDAEYTSMTRVGPADLLSGWSVVASDCQYEGVRRVTPVYGMRDLTVARVSCWDDETYQPATLYVILNNVPE